jgi:hypothetical protein
MHLLIVEPATYCIKKQLTDAKHSARRSKLAGYGTSID